MNERDARVWFFANARASTVHHAYITIIVGTYYYVWRTTIILLQCNYNIMYLLFISFSFFFFFILHSKTARDNVYLFTDYMHIYYNNSVWCFFLEIAQSASVIRMRLVSLQKNIVAVIVFAAACSRRLRRLRSSHVPLRIRRSRATGIH